ncbi:SRPBCC family protein [Streptococcus hyointestinalis]|uniref:SRPBCC family protein n=1 Tax=Streptococcus hyointestinalis TaxID=1337 RepID=UPI0013E0BF40|nr:SRPBCC family protein [Streptococcus hyointestinalis]
MTKRVIVEETIKAPLAETFDWFYKSEHFIKSPIVFRSSWRGEKHRAGTRRDIVMIAGWYSEEITAVEKDKFIQYRVVKSVPSVRQDFTEIAFEETSSGTKVTWTIDVDVPLPLLNKPMTGFAGQMAKTLYRTILKAGKEELENEDK